MIQSPLQGEYEWLNVFDAACTILRGKTICRAITALGNVTP
jgi:hypothetical protein